MMHFDKNLDCDDKLIQHYFSVKKLKDQHKISVHKSMLDAKTSDEITVHIEEELYYNNGECLVDGFVYISKGHNDDIVISVSERDCYSVKGYLHAAKQRDIVKKLQSAISCKKDIKKCVTGDLETLHVKDLTNDIKTKNNNIEVERDIVNNKYLLDSFNTCKTQKNENSISNTQKMNDNCTHKIENINKSILNEKGDKNCADQKQIKNVLYDDNDNSTRNYIAKENLFLFYHRKNINLIDLAYKNGKYLLQVNNEIENFVMKISLCKDVYDVEMLQYAGTVTYKHNIATWEIKRACIGLHELQILRFGKSKGNEQVNIKYECANYKNTGIRILEIQDHENVYVKSTFKTIKYEQTFYNQ